MLGLCQNSHKADIEFDLENNVHILMQILNTLENKSNGIIKNKIVLLMETLIKSKNLPLSEQIKAELDKFMSVVNKESDCFKEKLRILFEGVTSKANE